MIEPAKLQWIEATSVAAETPPPPPVDDGYDPDAIFELIERAAETIRSLQKNEASVATCEQNFKAQLERDRAIWRGDLDELRSTVEICLEKVAAAEREATASKAQAQKALAFCDEWRTREAAAVERADSAETRARLAEDRYKRLEAFLSKSFSDVLSQRVAN